MENYAQSTRFILSCNYLSKIIDPIQSRCIMFKFQPLSEKEIGVVIDHIAKLEKLQIDAAAKKAIFEVSQGDCRRAENILQSCAALSSKVTEDSVYALAAVAKPKEILEIMTLATQNKFIESRKLLLSTMLKYGLSGTDVIKQMQQKIWDLALDDKTKVKLVDRCGDVEFRMSEGSDEYLQIESFLAYLSMHGS
jgi:replication factor C small subunit